MQLKQTC